MYMATARTDSAGEGFEIGSADITNSALRELYK
jgi:hypothetical protein